MPEGEQPMNTSNSVQVERIQDDIEQIAHFSETGPEVGYSRPTFSPSWARARDYVISEAEQAGCEPLIDAHGNVHIRPRTYGWDTSAWLCGSHLDSVPSGGKYDGVAGVVCALELLRCGIALELIVFAEEEGTTFGAGMLGSRSWVGTLAVEELDTAYNKEGQSYIEAGIPFGVRPKAMDDDRVDPRRYHGFLEVHPEQGLSLWNRGAGVAAVTRINGRRHYTVTMSGQGNHAGSTRMADRRDALAGAAEAICEIERIGKSLAEKRDYSVMTVGRVNVTPNAVNVIAAEVGFMIDFRAQSSKLLQEGDSAIRAVLDSIASARSLSLTVTATEQLPPANLDHSVVRALRHAAEAYRVDLPEVPSGALHDAAILAPYIPTAMLFVASKGGISHDPEEFSRVEDIATAARLMAHVIGTDTTE